MANAGKTITDKAVAIVGPIALFVATGFEHSVANMFMVPLGILIRGEWAPNGYEDLTVANFLLHNLLPVTIGNIIGGGIMVGLFFWAVYVWQPKKEKSLDPVA